MNKVTNLNEYKKQKESKQFCEENKENLSPERIQATIERIRSLLDKLKEKQPKELQVVRKRKIDYPFGELDMNIENQQMHIKDHLNIQESKALAAKLKLNTLFIYDIIE